MKCTKCNNEIPEGSKFCNHCGTKVEMINGVKCPHCGYVNLSDTVNFCTECGKEIVSSGKYDGVMKIKSGFKLSQICGQHFILPMGESNIDFSKIISLNESSLLLCKRMAESDFLENDLVNLLIEKYDVNEQTARNDVRTFICQLKEEGIIEVK